MVVGSPPQALLSINDVSKAFPGVKALDRVSLEVYGGVVHGIVGENGAGKSTLMKILSGVYEKDSGEIVFEGQVDRQDHPAGIDADGTGHHLPGAEPGEHDDGRGERLPRAGSPNRAGRRGVHAKARKLLDSIGSKVSTHRMVSELSVSDKQMVEIAKALSFDSKLIIMDEPSSSLTDDEMKKLVQIIHDLKSKGIAIIYISHKLDEIFGFCDVVTVMRDGHVIDTRPVSEHDAQPDDLDDGRSDHRERVPAAAGQRGRDDPRDQAHQDPEAEGRPAHPAQGRDPRPGGPRGLGPNGTGAGPVRRRQGREQEHLSSMARPSEINSPIDAINLGLAMVPEDRKLQGLLLGFSVEQNISLAVLARLTERGFIDSKEESAVAIDRSRRSTSRRRPARTKIRTLSGGNQQKAILGRWLEMKPRILVLDEPTKGIDVGAKYEIYLLMKKIVEDGGSIILISSELPEVLHMSNRVNTICEGRVNGEFDPMIASADEIMEKAFEFA